MASIEKKLEKKLREEVKALGGIALKFFVLSFTGMPDRLVLMPGGKVWFVEMKDTGKPLSPRQEWCKNMLTKLGFRVYRIDSLELLEKFLAVIQYFK
jgi:hypothetical protein